MINTINIVEFSSTDQWKHSMELNYNVHDRHPQARQGVVQYVM